jgi:hypothetical protein
MSRFFLIVILPIILCIGACGTEPIKVTGTQTVDVPIPVRCTVPVIIPPILPFDTRASKAMPLFTKVQLLAVQDELLKGYNGQLVAALNGCATAPIPTLPVSPSK